MPDEHIFSTVCQVSPVSEEAQSEDVFPDINLSLLGKLTAADRQAIRDRARMAAEAMEEEAVPLLERPAMLLEDVEALNQALEDARATRALADALERKERGQ
jgi:hypothetical protein